MLYKREFLELTDTVIITEGEKDADTVTKLGLMGLGWPVCGITSGDANSWRASLAEQLRLLRVVVMPDDDEAGQRYADAVEESLKTEGIEYRRVSFAGTGAKDVSDYMATHTVEDLIRLVGVDWLKMPDGRELFDPGIELSSLLYEQLDDSDIPC